MYCLDLYLSCWCTAWFCLSIVGVLPGIISQLLVYCLVLSLNCWRIAWFCISIVGVLSGFVSQLLVYCPGFVYQLLGATWFCLSVVGVLPGERATQHRAARQGQGHAPAVRHPAQEHHSCHGRADHFGKPFPQKSYRHERWAFMAYFRAEIKPSCM